MPVYYNETMQREDICAAVSCLNLVVSCFTENMVKERSTINKISGFITLASNCLSFCRRDTLSLEDALNLASFLGEQLHNLHLLPCPPLNNLNFLDGVHKVNLPLVSDCLEDVPHKPNVPAEWEIFVRVLGRRKKDVKSRLNMWYIFVLFK